MTIHPRSWDLAGISDENTGSVDRPLPADSWQVPNIIELDGDRLVWDWDLSLVRERKGFERRRPEPGMLDAFVRLVDASPERLRDYARRWGLLGICEHGLPRTHNPPVYPHPASTDFLFASGFRSRPSAPADWGCEPMRCKDDGGPYDDDWFWEPLSPWRWFAGQARAVLNMIAAVHQGKAGSPEDVHAAHAGHRRMDWVPANVVATQLVIADCIDEWLQLARVRPVVRWLNGEAATISLGGGNLFGALGITLAMQAARTDGLAICSTCGIAYTPTRKPRADQRHYCPSCRADDAPSRDAAKDYRKRQRLA